MAATGSSAVFFLGSRAHYQVLQQPDSKNFDKENGNASTETIYKNPSPDIWNDPNRQGVENGGYIVDRNNWKYNDNGTEVSTLDDKDKMDINTGVKRRSKRRSSETTLCERDDMRPALLNNGMNNDTPKSKSRRRISPLSFLASLARRRRLYREQIQYLQHLEGVLTQCSYRESCRCLDCQSRYFECDDFEGYSSDENNYDYQPQQYITEICEQDDVDDEDDEVFIDSVPDDNTSTDLLIEENKPMSVSSDEVEDEDLQLEVAAGTPVLLNYLLTHPITCAIQ